MDTATAGHCQGESSVCTFGLNHPWLFLRPFSQWVWPDKYQLFGSTGNFLLCTTKNSCAVSFFFEKWGKASWVLWPWAPSGLGGVTYDSFSYPPTCYTEHCLSEHFGHAYMHIHESIHPKHHPFGIFELVFLVTISYQLPLHSPPPPKCWNTSSNCPSSLWAIIITKNLASLLRELKGTFAWMFSTLIIGANICICFSYISTHTSLAYTNGLKCLIYV